MARRPFTIAARVVTTLYTRLLEVKKISELLRSTLSTLAGLLTTWSIKKCGSDYVHKYIWIPGSSEKRLYIYIVLDCAVTFSRCVCVPACAACAVRCPVTGVRTRAHGRCVRRL